MIDEILKDALNKYLEDHYQRNGRNIEWEYQNILCQVSLFNFNKDEYKSILSELTDAFFRKDWVSMNISLKKYVEQAEKEKEPLIKFKDYISGIEDKIEFILPEKYLID